MLAEYVGLSLRNEALFMPTIGEWIFEKRTERREKLSQAQLARKAGVSRAYISLLERGGLHPTTGNRIDPDPSKLTRIAQAVSASSKQFEQYKQEILKLAASEAGYPSEVSTANQTPIDIATEHPFYKLFDTLSERDQDVLYSLAQRLNLVGAYTNLAKPANNESADTIRRYIAYDQVSGNIFTSDYIENAREVNMQSPQALLLLRALNGDSPEPTAMQKNVTESERIEEALDTVIEMLNSPHDADDEYSDFNISSSSEVSNES